mgnify:CR=1 FL=1
MGDTSQIDSPAGESIWGPHLALKTRSISCLRNYSCYDSLVNSVCQVETLVAASGSVGRITAIILRRFLRPMLAFRGDSPVSLTIPPRSGPAPDLFSGDGYILVLQPIR